MKDFSKRLKKGVVLFDGVMGTVLQARGLKAGHPPEEMLLSDFELVVSVHRDYVKAGAEVLTTNSFGLNPKKIAEYGHAKRFEELNRLAVRAAQKAAGEKVFVAGNIGPTGMFVEPVGELSFSDATRAFGDQARIQADEGVDLFILETFSDIKEIKAAIIGIREVSDKPIVAQMTFDESGRTTLGTPPEVAAVVLDALGVALIGANCSVGASAIAKSLRAMRPYTNLPFIAQPNAGMPTLKDGKTVFPDKPADMAAWLTEFIGLGCGAVGSCCGSTPEYTKVFKRELDRIGRAYKGPKDEQPGRATALASRTRVALIGPGLPCALIGERINPTRKKALTEEIRRGDMSGVRNEARQQEAGGADMLDVNVGVPGVDEAAAMRDAVTAVNSACALPIAIDSSNEEAIEAALIACDGKPLINSVNGEKKRLAALLPLARNYGAALLGLCTDESGVPKNAQDRLRIARKIINAAKREGIPARQVLLDPVTVPASAEPAQPGEAVRAVRLFTEKLKRGTVQGVSNISFGLPRRPALNAAHMAMAMEAGLSAAFINPLDERVAEIFFASRVLLAQDPAAKEYIHFASAIGGALSEPKAVRARHATPLPWDKALQQAVIEGEVVIVEQLTREAIGKGENPLNIGNIALVPGIREVGRRFEAQEMFLPHLLLSAEAMERGTAILREAIEKSGAKEIVKGTVALATVEGDIHDIGKNIVATLLRTHGWKVIDLGRSCPAARIISEARKSRSDIIGLSALMTTTVVKMPEIIEMARRSGIPVMVGGAVVTESYAKDIGADFYGPDAMAAVRGAELLTHGKKN